MVCKKPFKHKSGISFGCGQCQACRIDRARLWTSRIMLEARLHARSCFVTLTYNNEHLPSGGALVKKDAQLFLKRLRKHFVPLPIRFFCVGEYGDASGRPHYHLCLFGIGMEDESFIARAWHKEGKPIGFVKVDELNEGTANYVSQYVVKKWTRVDSFTAPLLKGRPPEFATMSLRPGIGAGAAPVVAKAIEGKDTDIPASLRMDGKIRPFGRYLKKKIREEFPNAKEIERYEKGVWLQKMYLEQIEELKAAKEEGKTPELYRWEKRRQRFLNKVNKQKNRKPRRSI